jgi:multicomponent Na+:H+ antiporter subunit E
VFHLVSLAGVLYALWLLLSGFLHEPLLLGLGVVSVCAVVFIAHRMDVVDHEGHPIHLSHRVGAYLPWLLWEIVKSNIAVAKVILSPRMPLSISVMTTAGSQQSDLGLTIYANSITLTPGTVTLGIDDNILTVYALTTDAADGVASGDMDRRVAALEA